MPDSPASDASAASQPTPAPQPFGPYPPDSAGHRVRTLITAVEDHLSDLEVERCPDQLTPMQIQTALLRAQAGQAQTLADLEILEARAAVDPDDPYVSDAINRLQDLEARTAKRIQDLKEHVQVDALTPLQRETLADRWTALMRRLTRLEERMCQQIDQIYLRHRHRQAAERWEAERQQREEARWEATRQANETLTAQIRGTMQRMTASLSRVMPPLAASLTAPSDAAPAATLPTPQTAALPPAEPTTPGHAPTASASPTPGAPTPAEATPPAPGTESKKPQKQR